jgi:hypothetical protein
MECHIFANKLTGRSCIYLYNFSFSFNVFEIRCTKIRLYHSFWNLLARDIIYYTWVGTLLKFAIARILENVYLLFMRTWFR